MWRNVYLVAARQTEKPLPLLGDILSNKRLPKDYEAQVFELQARFDEQNKLIQKLQATKSRLQTEVGDHERQNEELENQQTQIGKSKAQGLAQLEDAKRILEEEHQKIMEVCAPKIGDKIY
ncbi:Myosin N-terminal SH3-like domain [Globodera pallida]|nr:Myosin N-terminal SH3-like domain [Globodera pallida]